MYMNKKTYKRKVGGKLVLPSFRHSRKKPLSKNTKLKKFSNPIFNNVISQLKIYIKTKKLKTSEVDKDCLHNVNTLDNCRKIINKNTLNKFLSIIEQEDSLNEVIILFEMLVEFSKFINKHFVLQIPSKSYYKYNFNINERKQTRKNVEVSNYFNVENKPSKYDIRSIYATIDTLENNLDIISPPQFFANILKKFQEYISTQSGGTVDMKNKRFQEYKRIHDKDLNNQKIYESEFQNAVEFIVTKTNNEALINFYKKIEGQIEFMEFIKEVKNKQEIKIEKKAVPIYFYLSNKQRLVPLINILDKLERFKKIDIEFSTDKILWYYFCFARKNVNKYSPHGKFLNEANFINFFVNTTLPNFDLFLFPQNKDYPEHSILKNYKYKSTMLPFFQNILNTLLWRKCSFFEDETGSICNLSMSPKTCQQEYDKIKSNENSIYGKNEFSTFYAKIVSEYLNTDFKLQKNRKKYKIYLRSLTYKYSENERPYPVGWKPILEKFIKNLKQNVYKNQQKFLNALYKNLDLDINLFLAFKLWEDKQCIDTLNCSFERKMFLHKYFNNLCDEYPDECESFHSFGMTQPEDRICDEVKQNIDKITHSTIEICKNKIDNISKDANKKPLKETLDNEIQTISSLKPLGETEHLIDKLNHLNYINEKCNTEIPPYSQKYNDEFTTKVYTHFSENEIDFEQFLKSDLWTIIFDTVTQNKPTVISEFSKKVTVEEILIKNLNTFLENRNLDLPTKYPTELFDEWIAFLHPRESNQLQRMYKSFSTDPTTVVWNTYVSEQKNGLKHLLNEESIKKTMIYDLKTFINSYDITHKINRNNTKHLNLFNAWLEQFKYDNVRYHPELKKNYIDIWNENVDKEYLKLSETMKNIIIREADGKSKKKKSIILRNKREKSIGGNIQNHFVVQNIIEKRLQLNKKPLTPSYTYLLNNFFYIRYNDMNYDVMVHKRPFKSLITKKTNYYTDDNVSVSNVYLDVGDLVIYKGKLCKVIDIEKKYENKYSIIDDKNNYYEVLYENISILRDDDTSYRKYLNEFDNKHLKSRLITFYKDDDFKNFEEVFNNIHDDQCIFDVLKEPIDNQRNTIIHDICQVEFDKTKFLNLIFKKSISIGSIFIENKYKQTPILLALEKNNTEAVNLFLKKAKWKILNLHINNQISVMKRILGRQSYLYQLKMFDVYGDNENPLFISVFNNDIEVTELLLSRNIGFEKKECYIHNKDEYYDILSLAILNVDNFNIIDILINHQLKTSNKTGIFFEISKGIHRSKTPFLFAFERGEIAIIEKLFKYNDPEYLRDQTQTVEYFQNYINKSKYTILEILQKKVIDYDFFKYLLEDKRRYDFSFIKIIFNDSEKIFFENLKFLLEDTTIENDSKSTLFSNELRKINEQSEKTLYDILSYKFGDKKNTLFLKSLVQNNFQIAVDILHYLENSDLHFKNSEGYTCLDLVVLENKNEDKKGTVNFLNKLLKMLTFVSKRQENRSLLAENPDYKMFYNAFKICLRFILEPKENKDGYEVNYSFFYLLQYFLAIGYRYKSLNGNRNILEINMLEDDVYFRLHLTSSTELEIYKLVFKLFRKFNFTTEKLSKIQNDLNSYMIL